MYAYRQPKGDRLTNCNTLISQYGYAALVIGSLAEGETVTLRAGVAAHQGLLKFPLVVFSVALGGMIGDQVLYLWVAVWRQAVTPFLKHQDKIERAQKLIQRHPYLFVIGTRFMYGFRVIGPTLIGASQLPPKIFLPLNILGAFAWALIFTTIGYAGGQVIAPWLHTLTSI
ncbi:DedA family protein [Escherichia coli]